MNGLDNIQRVSGSLPQTLELECIFAYELAQPCTAANVPLNDEMGSKLPFPDLRAFELINLSHFYDGDTVLVPCRAPFQSANQPRNLQAHSKGMF